MAIANTGDCHMYLQVSSQHGKEELNAEQLYSDKWGCFWFLGIEWEVGDTRVKKHRPGGIVG